MNSAGRGGNGAALRSGVFIIGHVREVACGPQKFLPTVHLTGKCIPHPRHEVRLVGQVRDDRRHMAYPVKAKECAVTTPYCASLNSRGTRRPGTAVR